jgi:hypothetical protein
MFTRASLLPTAFFAAVALFIVGGLGAWLAVQLVFPYSLLTPISCLIYGAAGFFAARTRAAGWIAGAIVALLDATAWAAFGGIGPQPVYPDMSLASKLATVAIVSILGAGCGWIGARIFRRRIAKAKVCSGTQKLDT